MNTDKRTKKLCFSELPVIQGEKTVLKPLTDRDAGPLSRLAADERVYRWLPTFLFERKYADAHEVIRRLYTECLEESLIFGVFENGVFCGLAEFYGYKDPIHKISVGYRLLPECWGRGLASDALGAMIRFLYGQTDIEIITASTMVENSASAKVLQKNDFTLVVSGAEEDWGYGRPTIADKWIR